MNIGIVTSWHEGGAGYVSRAYMNVLKSHGHDVQIYVRGGRYYPMGNPIWDLPNVTWGIRYEPPGKLTQFNMQYVNMCHFEKWLYKHNISVIITNEDTRFELAKRAKSLGYVVGTYIDYYKKDTVNEFNVYDFLLCNTKRHHSVFAHMPYAFYIPWGTDINVFKPQSDRDKRKNDDTLVFFHSANFGGRNCRKGTDLLLKAFQKINGKVELVIHSQAPLSKFGDDAAEIVKKDKRIEFIEKTVPAPGLYHRGDIFVYPTRLEGIGLCVPEALACGLPVVTTDNAPMNEFVQDNVNGLLVKVKETRKREDGYYWPEKIADIDDLANKMQTYINDRNLLMRHKHQARESAEKYLDWMKNASALSNNLQSLLKNTTKKRRPNFYEHITWRCEAAYVSLLTYTRTIARKILRRGQAF